MNTIAFNTLADASSIQDLSENLIEPEFKHIEQQLSRIAEEWRQLTNKYNVNKDFKDPTRAKGFIKIVRANNSVYAYWAKYTRFHKRGDGDILYISNQISPRQSGNYTRQLLEKHFAGDYLEDVMRFEEKLATYRAALRNLMLMRKAIKNFSTPIKGE